jgi:hypothetical protein
MVGNIPDERADLIGIVPVGALVGSEPTGFPYLSFDFPEFLEGIWGESYGDTFHLEEGKTVGYTLSGWPPSLGWDGNFMAVYYFDDAEPEKRGLFFANFTTFPGWVLVPPNTTYRISAFYYEQVAPEDPDTYYLLNLAKADSETPGYEYGQPMYPSIAAALDELITQGALDDMLIVWVPYERQVEE